jgi:hypothetical protein
LKCAYWILPGAAEKISEEARLSLFDKKTLAARYIAGIVKILKSADTSLETIVKSTDDRR